MEPPTSPAAAAQRMVSAASSGASPKPRSRSADTGRSVASTIARACASASSRVTCPSRRPNVPADAPLDVASAMKPKPASTRAEPASHGFPMTNAFDPWCSALKRAAFSACEGITARRPRPCFPQPASLPDRAAGNSRRAPPRWPRARSVSVASSSCSHSFQEAQDVFEGKAAALQEAHLPAALAIVGGRGGEAAPPHFLYVLPALVALARATAPGVFRSDALDSLCVRHLGRPQGPL